MPIAKYKGIDSIVEIFEERATKPYWALWQGKEMHDQYTGEDMDESLIQLRKQLNDIRDSGNNNVLVLHPHNFKLAKTDIKYPFKDEKKYPVTYPIYCCVSETNMGMISGMPGYNTPVIPYDNRINERLNSIESTLNALAQKEIEENEEDGIDNENDQLDKITSFLENDTVKSIIGLIVGNISSRQPQQITSLGNINDEWEHYLNILFSKGLTLDHLKKLANMPEAKIKALLNMI